MAKSAYPHIVCLRMAAAVAAVSMRARRPPEVLRPAAVFSILAGLWIAFCPPAAAQQGPALKINIDYANANNVFTTGEPVRMEFNISGARPGSQIRMEYTVTDFFGEQVLKNTKTISVSNEGDSSKAIDWTHGRNGVFDIWARVEQEEVTAEARDTFCVIPPPRETRLQPESAFGITFGIPELMGYSGAKWSRTDAYWDQLEPEKGRFDFSVLDNHLNEANKHGVELLPIIDYSASWASSAPPEVPAPERCMYPPRDTGEWSEYVTALVLHYRGKIKAWEIWNEVNAFDTFFKTGSVEKYTELLKAAYTAIKKADPEAKVIGCATTGVDTSFIEDVFKAGGFDYMDAVSVHPYRGTRSPEESGLEKDLSKLRSLVGEYGGGKELWNTEFGWWADDFQPEYAAKGIALAEREQANYLVRSYCILLSSGFKKIFWFTHRHHVKDFSQSTDAGIGLLYHDYKLKPAAVAYRTMTDELEETVPASKEEAGGYVQAYLFRKKDKGDVLAAWSRGQAELIAVRAGGEYITAVDMMNNRRRMDASKGPCLVPLEQGCVTFLEGENLEVLGRIAGVELEGDILIPGKTQHVTVSLNNLLPEDLISSVKVTVPPGLRVDPGRQDFAVKQGHDETRRFSLTALEDTEYGERNVTLEFELPGKLKKPLEITKSLQIMPAGSIRVEDFEGDTSGWKTNAEDDHVVYNRIEKSSEFAKEGKYSLHWTCNSPGKWNTITKDISGADLKETKQISFWIYVPHAQKGGEQGMGIELVENDGSRYYHSGPIIPLHPLSQWNFVVLDLNNFYLPSFSRDENNKLDVEQLQFLLFNLTAGEFDVYLDDVRISRKDA